MKGTAQDDSLYLRCLMDNLSNAAITHNTKNYFTSYLCDHVIL